MPLSKIHDNLRKTLLNPGADNSALSDIIRHNHGASIDDRLQIYRHNIMRSLTNRLLAAMPLTTKLVGDKFLRQAAKDFIRQHPPEQGSLTDYGTDFPLFIRSYLPAASLPYLYDFTRLEWAKENAYNAPDDKALDPENLTVIAPEKLPFLAFYFRRSFRLLESEYPLDAITDLCQHEGDQNLHELSPKGVKIMIFRPGLDVHIDILTPAEYIFVDSLHKGTTIHTAGEAALEIQPDFDLAGNLQNLLKHGVFSGFALKKN